MIDDKTFNTLKKRQKNVDGFLKRAIESSVRSSTPPVFKTKEELVRLKELFETVKSVTETKEDTIWKYYFDFLKEVQKVIDKHRNLKVFYKYEGGIDAYNVLGGLHNIVYLIVAGGSETNRDERIFK